MFFGIIKCPLVAKHRAFCCIPIKCPYMIPGRLYVQSIFLYGERNFNKKFGIILEIPFFQTIYCDHRTIGGIMQTAKLIFFRFSSNHLYLLIKRTVPIDVYGN